MNTLKCTVRGCISPGGPMEDRGLCSRHLKCMACEQPVGEGLEDLGWCWDHSPVDPVCFKGCTCRKCAA